MKTKTASSRMESLIALYDMHTDFFAKAIEGISDEDSHNRLNTKANHPAWIAGSMVEGRFELAKDLGPDKEIKQESYELFENHQGIKDDAEYPSMDSYLNDWKRISPIVRKLFVDLTDEKLDSQFKMPEMKMSYYEFTSFIIYREANMIGQLALWRRLLGYDAIKYD